MLGYRLLRLRRRIVLACLRRIVGVDGGVGFALGARSRRRRRRSYLLGRIRGRVEERGGWAPWLGSWDGISVLVGERGTDGLSWRE